jgi:hypothetical protein
MIYWNGNIENYYFVKHDITTLHNIYQILKTEKTHVFASNFSPSWSSQSMCHNLKTCKFKV